MSILISKIKILRFLVWIKKTKFIENLKVRMIQNLDTLNDTNTKLKEQLFQSIPFWFASAVTGFLAYLYYLTFRYAEKLSFFIVENHRWAIFILTPSFVYTILVDCF